MSSDRKTMEFGVNSLRKGGKLVMVGLYGGSQPISTVLFPFKMMTIEGSYVFRSEDDGVRRQQPAQGRQAGHGRAVWRVAADLDRAVPVQDDDDRRLLCLQIGRRWSSASTACARAASWSWSGCMAGRSRSRPCCSRSR